MKTQIALMALLIVSFLAVANADYTGSEGNAPEDQPNFKPKVTQDTADEKNVEIIEFKCKFK
ncbi:MAG: hypothetical protein ABI337_08615 [Nitrososphaera sp.]|jgi:hypothetical protein